MLPLHERRELFRWLAANLWSKVQNSKFRIQYSYKNFEKLNKLKNVDFEVQIVKSRKLKV